MSGRHIKRFQGDCLSNLEGAVIRGLRWTARSNWRMRLAVDGVMVGRVHHH